MDSKTAQKFPLLRGYDFSAHHLAISIGMGVLLLPKNKIYSAESYSFKELILIPHLQGAFNEGRDIEAGDLIAELKKNGEFSLVPDPALNRNISAGKREISFLEKTLRRFGKDGIARVEKREGSEEFLNPRNLIVKGKNYDLTRVFSVEGCKSEIYSLGYRIFF